MQVVVNGSMEENDSIHKPLQTLAIVPILTLHVHYDRLFWKRKHKRRWRGRGPIRVVGGRTVGEHVLCKPVGATTIPRGGLRHNAGLSNVIKPMSKDRCRCCQCLLTRFHFIQSFQRTFQLCHNLFNIFNTERHCTHCTQNRTQCQCHSTSTTTHP